jgi:predicted secreted Zn-dependent protease
MAFMPLDAHHLPKPTFPLRAAFAACVLLQCWPAAAEVSESIAYRYFVAKPSADTTLSRSVLQASPIRENGKTHMGHASWNVKWEMAWTQRRDGQCTMDKVRTHLHAVITLPQVAPSNEQEQIRFDKFFKALRDHETGHVDIAREAAREIDRRIQKMPSMASCHDLEAAANALGHRLLGEARQRGQDYDLQTGHGKTQGAVLN